MWATPYPSIDLHLVEGEDRSYIISWPFCEPPYALDPS